MLYVLCLKINQPLRNHVVNNIFACFLYNILYKCVGSHISLWVTEAAAGEIMRSRKKILLNCQLIDFHKNHQWLILPVPSGWAGPKKSTWDISGAWFQKIALEIWILDVKSNPSVFLRVLQGSWVHSLVRCGALSFCSRRARGRAHKGEKNSYW